MATTTSSETPTPTPQTPREPPPTPTTFTSSDAYGLVVLSSIGAQAPPQRLSAVPWQALTTLKLLMPRETADLIIAAYPGVPEILLDVEQRVLEAVRAARRGR